MLYVMCYICICMHSGVLTYTVSSTIASGVNPTPERQFGIQTGAAESLHTYIHTWHDMAYNPHTVHTATPVRQTM